MNREMQLQQVIDWANTNEAIRAALLTSSMVNPDAPVDRFSDLNIELVVRDLPLFLSDDSWISRFGTIIAIVVEDEAAFDGKHAMRMVFYEDYSKIDFKIYGIPRFREEVLADELCEDWDVGYKVLVDKDNLTSGMKPPTYQSVLIRKPEQAEYDHIFNDFWWDMTYVAKCLCRDELFYAKFMSEDNMRTQYLIKIIEWHIGLEQGWNITVNKKGRFFKRYLSPELWQKIEATFSGSDIEDNWDALFAYAALGRELGLVIAAALGYHYPRQLDEKISAYLHWARALGKPGS